MLAHLSVMTPDVGEVMRAAAALPSQIAHLAAGEIDAAIVLSDIYALLSELRVLQAAQLIDRENVLILQREYEQVAERLVAGSHPSPFAATADLSVTLPDGQHATLPALEVGKAAGKSSGLKALSDRAKKILDIVRKNKSVSIKDIAGEVRGCSEKTLQREIATLIEARLVRKVGERRWTLYLPL
ncbi:MAG: hypothetical protein KGI70_01010 [Patescibacteria group bacterium]|nr:hypothetical protein [Patescibacteria group bacterium]